MTTALALGCAARRLPSTLAPDDLIPWESADGWRGRVRHYAGPGEPVLLVHGMGANHYNWDFRPEVSLAAWLAEQGWDVWVAELRGDPQTRPPDARAGRNWSFDDHAEQDVPAIVGAVLDATGRERLYWVGHSMGGMLLYTALALRPEQIAAGVAIGAPVRFDEQPPLHRLARRVGFLAGHRGLLRLDLAMALSRPLGYANPAYALLAQRGNLDWPLAEGIAAVAIEPVPRAMAQQVLGWLRSGELTRVDGRPWLEGQPPDVPVLVLVGDRDRIAPPATALTACDAFPRCESMVLGPDGELAASYGHVDPVLGQTAVTEIYPLIAGWLAAQLPDR